MELNTATSPAAGTFPPVVLEHGEPSVRVPSLLSPAFSPAPSPGLIPASGSGSGSSWYQQIPPSLAVAAGNDSLSVHTHTMSSSQSVPLSSFPIASMLPMVDYDLFGNNPEATAATHLPALLGGQWQQRELSSTAAPVLPECPSRALFGFPGKSAAWQSEEMSLPFFSPSSAGGLELVGFVPPSSGPEFEPLPQSLRIPSLAAEETPVNTPMLPIEEAEIDVSAFLVSDPVDQLPNASWMVTSLQMGGGGGGRASPSWMAPGSTYKNWTPMLASTAASTCTMVGTRSGSMTCHSGSWGSSSSHNFAGSMLCFDRSTPIDNYRSSSMTKLSIQGKMPSTSGLPLLPKAGASSKGGAGIVFTDPEMAIIAKDKKLHELVRTDQKKVKRILYNRAYSATSKVRKVMYAKNLEEEIVTLQEERRSLCAQLKSLEEGSAALMAQKMEMEMLIGELEQQEMLKDAVREGLKAEIRNLKHLKLK